MLPSGVMDPDNNTRTESSSYGIRALDSFVNLENAWINASEATTTSEAINYGDSSTRGIWIYSSTLISERAGTAYGLNVVGPGLTPSTLSMVRLFLLTEIRFDNFVIIGDVFRQSVCDAPTVIDYVDPVRNIHNHTHIVLNEDNSIAPVTEIADERYQSFGFLGVHPCSGFVKENDMRVRGNGPGDFKLALFPVGQIRRIFINLLFHRSI